MRLREKIEIVNNSTTHKTHEKKLSNIFRQLRLVSAQVILRYESDRTDLRKDIHHTDHVCELSEEYAFRALCLWLVTTFGSSICKTAIDSDLERVANCLSEVFSKTGAYPFANDLSAGITTQVLESAKTLLSGFPAQLEMIGSLYEHIHKYPLYFDAHGNFDIPVHIQEKDKRRLVGQFYTPSHIVDYCFQRAVEAEKDKFIIELKSVVGAGEEARRKRVSAACSQAVRVLDPSCGTGNFLLGAIRLFRRHCSNPLTMLDLVGANIFGMELDGRAASLTRVVIMLALVDSWLALPDTELRISAQLLFRALRDNIKNIDTVYAAPLQFVDDDGRTEHSQLGNAFSPGGYALVITNPPYVSFGARNQPKLADSAIAYFRDKYPQSAEYKVRIHSIFQDICLRFAKPGGVACLLVPDGFLTGGYYKKLRQLLLVKSKLRSFSELPADTVPGAVVGRWCVACYERVTHEEPDYGVDLYSHIAIVPESYTLPKSLLVSRDQNRFRLVFNKIDQRLCELIDKLEPLSSQFQGRTGIRALHGQNSVVADRCGGDRWRRGITSGSSVVPHIVTWKGDWLNIDSSLLYKGGYDADVIENPKILVRQTGDRLVAAYDEDGLYHLNNVHSLSGRSHATASLHFIDGLLNSTFWLYLYRLKTREQGRALAQIDIETLESMPLPEHNAAMEKEIATLTQLYRKIAVPSNKDIQTRVAAAIDKLVYDLYELDSATVQQISRCCGTLNNSDVEFSAAKELLTLQQMAESEGVICRQ